MRIWKGKEEWSKKFFMNLALFRGTFFYSVSGIA
jgi:hypothetical protein